MNVERNDPPPGVDPRRPMRILKTPICTLEPQVAGHAAEMFSVLGDPAIYEFENSPPESEAWLEDRFRKLEMRQSVDGAEHWLNWVVRLPGGSAAGYVQATVVGDHVSYVAYELASRFWRRGIGRSAVAAMEAELVGRYDVRTLVAVLKAANFRSFGLLSSLAYQRGSAAQAVLYNAEPDEWVMLKEVSGG